MASTRDLASLLHPVTKRNRDIALHRMIIRHDRPLQNAPHIHTSASTAFLQLFQNLVMENLDAPSLMINGSQPP